MRGENIQKDISSKYGIFLRKYGFFYLLILPGLIYLIVFKYLPLAGLTIAFKQYQPGMGFQGIFTSQWVGLKHFRKFMGSYYFGEIMRNTLMISFAKLLLSYMPNFMSWVVVSGIIVAIFSTDGAANNVLNSIGCPPVSFLSQSSSFLKIIIISDVWKYAGWDSIIYSAAIMSIDPTLYEAASMDGAGKLRQIWHVTLPGISSVIAITLILRMGGILEAGFEQILMLYSPAVYDVADIIDTYVYREGLQMANYSFSTAVSLFKSVLAAIMVLITNFLSKKVSGEGLW